jgi:hypothetical protein
VLSLDFLSARRFRNAEKLAQHSVRATSDRLVWLSSGEIQHRCHFVVTDDARRGSFNIDYGSDRGALFLATEMISSDRLSNSRSVAGWKIGAKFLAATRGRTSWKPKSLARGEMTSLCNSKKRGALLPITRATNRALAKSAKWVWGAGAWSFSGLPLIPACRTRMLHF